MREILIQGFQELGLTVDDLALDRLCQYARLLLEQNRVMNLTAITQPEQVARLHFLDSAAILSHGSSQGPGWLAGKRLIDVGTGAGFPGMVLKILEPSLRLTLADSLGKRITWLSEVCKVLFLDDIQCLHVRAEELALEEGYRDSFDVVTSRAVASFPALCELCLPFAKAGGCFIAMKSVDSAAEVQQGVNAVKRLGGSLSASTDYPVPGAGVTHRLVRVDKSSPTPQGLPRSWGRIKRSPL